MLRNAIVHIANEQPLMADLVVEPTTGDVCLLCRNIRTMNGTKPVFVDYPDSTFLLPLTQIRFVEIPAKAYAQADEANAGVSARGNAGESNSPGGSVVPISIVPANVVALNPSERSEPLLDGAEVVRASLEAAPDAVETSDGTDSGGFDEGLDSDLLRRIREI